MCELTSSGLLGGKILYIAYHRETKHRDVQNPEPFKYQRAMNTTIDIRSGRACLLIVYVCTCVSVIIYMNATLDILGMAASACVIVYVCMYVRMCACTVMYVNVTMDMRSLYL